MRQLLLSCFLLTCHLLARGQEFTVTPYSTNEGLVQSQVMALMQDSRGYLWLGTHGGIDRYNGNAFHHFGEEEGVPGNFIADLLEDRTGIIWAATNNGLSWYDGLQFRTYTTADGLPENDLRELMEDQKGHLWIASQSTGLCVFDGNQFLPNPFRWEEKPKELQIESLLQGADGKVWIGTRSGLYVKEGEQAIRSVSLGSREKPREIYDLHQDQSGIIWLGTDEGLIQYDGSRFRVYPRETDKMSDQQVFCMAEDEEGALWLGTQNGIIRFQEGRFRPLRRIDRTLAYRMSSAMVDNEGNIWFGTDGGGARKITEGTFASYDMQNGLSSNLAKSFLEDQQGNIWISTKDRGINVWDGEKVIQRYDQQGGLGGDDICSSFEDQAGNFWFASYNGTLTRYDGKQFQTFSDEDGLLCNSVFVATEGPEGELWVGTDNGIFLFDGQRFYPHPGNQQDFFSSIIYSLLTDQRGIVWVGTADGLARWEEGNFVVEPPDSVVGSNVITLAEDPLGRVWIGSAVGLACIENGLRHWIRISGTRGAHTVVSLVMEGNRDLWIGTENGVYRLSLAEYDPDQRNNFEHYIKTDGLPSLESNANAAFQSSNQGVWIGTAEGAIFRPSNTPRKKPDIPPKVYLTHVKGTAEQSWEEQGFVLNEYGLPQDLQLPYQDNRLEFEFIGISLKSPQQVEYQIKLEGLEDNWSGSLRQTRFVYPNLDPGTYTFWVRAKLETEEWDQAPETSFEFVIHHPYWATWWFISLAILALAAVVWGIVRFYADRRQQQAEERRIRHRAEKLQLEHQALYAMMNPHFTFNALQSIQYFIHRQDKISANKFLSSFAKLIRKNLESTKADFISMGEEIDRLKLYLSLEKMRFPEKFDYEIQVEPLVDLAGTQIPPMLLQPFVENSIKHGIMSLEENGKIEISVSQPKDDYLHIAIRDNGIGIEASKLRKANRPTDHVSKGMQITLDRLALFARMSGKDYELDIREWQHPDGSIGGTVVEMVLPINNGVSGGMD